MPEISETQDSGSPGVWDTIRESLRGRGDRWTDGVATVFLTSVGLVFILTANQIVGIFTADPAVAGYAVDCLRTVSYGFILYAGGMVLTQAFNGAGDTWTPTVINLLVFWLFEIPVAYFLAKTLGMGPHGVFLAITIAFSVLTFVSAGAFQMGKWKQRLV